MKHLFTVNTEGGPLLVLDAATAAEWSGIEGDDYLRLSRAFDESPKAEAIPFATGVGRGLAWEMHGAGSADVFEGLSGCITILRAWLPDGDENRLQDLAEVPANFTQDFGHIEAPSSCIAILWAPESGRGISLEFPGNYIRVTRNASISESIYIVRVRSARFECLHDVVRKDGAEARRLRLLPVGAPGGT